MAAGERKLQVRLTAGKGFRFRQIKGGLSIMENYSIHLPAYTIGPDAYARLAAVCGPYGKTAVIIGGHRAMEAAADAIEDAAGKEITIFGRFWYGGECSYENAAALAKKPEVQKAELLFAVGGGKAMDTVKALAHQLGKPVFTFPTIASNCAATTAVSIMYREDGVFKGPYFFEAPPVHAFIQTRIIAAAPKKYMWAGMGDTYAKYYEASLSSRGEDLSHYFGLGVQVSRMCVDPILEKGEKALADNEAGIASKELEQVVLAIVVTTGIASILLTAEHTVDYNSGLAHAIFYALTVYPQIEKQHLHGEVVGFGILVLLLTDGQRDEFERVYAFHRRTGLPVCIADIDISPDELKEVIPVITGMGDIKHWPYPVTEQMLTEAFDELECRVKE